jgi:apolipoprotein N-acyltransferase
MRCSCLEFFGHYTRPNLKLYAWTMFAAQAVAWTILLGWLHNCDVGWLVFAGPVRRCVDRHLVSGGVVGAARIIGRPTLTRLFVMLGLAATWVLIEWTRTWLLGGFPVAPLSASQWERSSILQIAAYSGAYGVSFVLVMMNLGFGAYAHRLFLERGRHGINKRSQEFFLAAVSAAHVRQHPFSRSVQPRGIHATLCAHRIVQPNIPQECEVGRSTWPGIRDILINTTLDAAASRPDLILWPESATQLAVRGDENGKDWSRRW